MLVEASKFYYVYGCVPSMTEQFGVQQVRNARMSGAPGCRPRCMVLAASVNTRCFEDHLG